jgi:geranylgeranyl diphosphate synthase type II
MSADAFQPKAQIDGALARFLGSLTLPKNLMGAIEYALLGGGKKLRPILAWHACAATGAPGEASLPAGVAVELVHAFSLVHDDLPALDNDDLRRGRPTLHVHAGEAMAILAGDALLTLAFRSIAEAGLEPALGAALLRELSGGTMGMIAGQVHDTVGGLDPLLTAAQQVRSIHSNKTGSLIRAAVRMGGLCGLAGKGVAAPEKHESLRALSAYGEAVGVIFQIADDLIDVEQSPERTGKRTGKDLKAGKLTYPGVIGVEESRREIERLRSTALMALVPLGPPAEGLRWLCDVLAHRTS